MNNNGGNENRNENHFGGGNIENYYEPENEVRNPMINGGTQMRNGGTQMRAGLDEMRSAAQIDTNAEQVDTINAAIMAENMLAVPGSATSRRMRGDSGAIFDVGLGAGFRLD
jgi:hypothetical protein